MLRFRESPLWKHYTDDLVSPDADLLPDQNPPWTPLTVAVCTVGAVGLALAGYLLPDSPPILEILAPLAHVCLFAIASSAIPSLGIRQLRKRFDANPPTAMVGAYMVLLAPLNAFAMLLIAPLFTRAIALDPENMPIAAAAFGIASCLWVWAYVVWRARVIGQLRNRVAEERARADTAADGRRAAEMELKSLQAQIEPHFLYNTLANVQQLLRQRPGQADEMLTGLIRYLRAALPKMREKCSLLGQEFALSTAYLEIVRVRFGGRLTCRVELPKELEEAPFPPLMIQTLVENAVKHGIEPKVGPVTIALSARKDGDELVVTVEDDGVGLGMTQGMGVGLRNTRERLTAIFGEAGQLELAPNVPSGVLATLRVPLEPAPTSA